MEEILEEQKEQYTDIHPLTKGRRTLLFLADFFLSFFLSFFFMSAAIVPIGKAITNYNQKNEEHIEVSKEMYNLYYDSGVLRKNTSSEYYDVTASIEFSYRCFLSYLVLEQETSIDPNHPEYGHKEENNMINHFYKDIRNNEKGYIDLFATYFNEKYFIDKTSVTLKLEVKNELYAFFDPKDELGDIGKGYYDEIQNKTFNPMIAEVLADIEKNDLKVSGHSKSFIDCKTILKSLETYHDNLMIVSSFIAHLIGWSIYFVAVPLFRRDRKTFAMIIMKIERVNFYSLNHLKRWEQGIYSIYPLVTNLLGIMFLPFFFVPFNNLFAISWLLYSSLFGLVLVLASLVFMLFNQYNRSLTDYLSSSLCISEAEMDEIYKARGYDI